MGHGSRIQHLLSRDLASVVTAEPAAHQSGMYRYGWGLVAAGGPGHEKAIRRRRRTTFSGPFRGALSGPQSRMTRCCAPAGLVAACPNAPARRVERAERAGVLVGRGSGPTEGRTIRVGLPGRTATDEMVDRLLAALSGRAPVRCKGDVGTAAVGHRAGCGDGGGWLHGRRIPGT